MPLSTGVQLSEILWFLRADRHHSWSMKMGTGESSHSAISSIVKPALCWRTELQRQWRCMCVEAKQVLTYRKVAESIYWRWPFLQLGCSVGHDIIKEGLHGWLMKRLLRRRSLLLHQQAWIKLTRLLHHLLLYTKRSTLQRKWWRKIVRVCLYMYTLFISELTPFSEGRTPNKVL